MKQSKKQAAIGFIFITMLIDITGWGIIIPVIPKLISEIGNIQNYLPQAEKVILEKYMLFKYEVFNKTGYNIEDSFFKNTLDSLNVFIKEFILEIPSSIGLILEWSILIPIFVFFFLRDFDGLKRILFKFVPNSLFERIYFVGNQFNKQLGDYIFAKIIEASFMGIVITSGLFFLDVRFALLLGGIAAITNIIPYVGPILGAIPALLLGFIEFGQSQELLMIAVLFALANILDIFLVFPILVSKIVDLHPLVVIVSVIIGSQFFGIWGMVLSIPFAAAIKLILVEIYDEFYHASLF